MKKIVLDKNILIGGIIHDEKNYQIVHMNLKKGNQTDSYSNTRDVLIFNVSGKITVSTEEKVETLGEFEILEIKKENDHVITCLEDAQVVVFKVG